LALVTRQRAWFLYAFAAWTVFVWVVFIKNMVGDKTHGTGFKVVHITLAVISLAFAAGCFKVVSAIRSSARATSAKDAVRSDT
jgi:hypothetical protein